MTDDDRLVRLADAECAVLGADYTLSHDRDVPLRPEFREAYVRSLRALPSPDPDPVAAAAVECMRFIGRMTMGPKGQPVPEEWAEFFLTVFPHYVAALAAEGGE